MKQNRVGKQTVTSKKEGFAILDREKARKDAPVAIKVLRRIEKDARADLSVDESYPNCLGYYLSEIEQTLNAMLPPDNQPKACIDELFEDDDESDGASVV